MMLELLMLSQLAVQPSLHQQAVLLEEQFLQQLPQPQPLLW
jgi:hypothetical protein